MIGTLTNDCVFRNTHNHDFHNQVFLAVLLMGPLLRHINRAQKASGILFPNFRPAICVAMCDTYQNIITLCIVIRYSTHVKL